jgi:hypothetical protein
METDKPNLVEALKKSKKLVHKLKSHSPKSVDASSLSPKSKLPFKAMSIRDLLYHRFAELTDVAVRLYESNKVVSASILTRASLETFALLYYLYKKMQDVVETNVVGEIDDILMKILFGCKDGSLPIESVNILTAIDHFDKQFGPNKKLLRHFYDMLSESSHPNWFGTGGAYGILDQQNRRYILGTTNHSASTLCVLALLTTLEGFHLYYLKIGEVSEAFIAICDRDIKEGNL